MLRTANGAVIGPLLGYGAGSPYLTEMRVWIESVGKLVFLDQRTGLNSNGLGCTLYFEATGCTGAPFVPIGTGGAAFDAVCAAGTKMWTVNSEVAADITYHSYLTQSGVCSQVPSGSFVNVVPAVEVIVPGYPFTGPLTISYE